MQLKSKLLLAGLVAGTCLASTNAMAVAFPDFQVTEGSVPGAIANTFFADKITGNYVEVATFGPGNTFNVSIKWQAGQYVALDGSTPVPSQLGGLAPNNYGLYGLLQGSGTFSTSGTGVTTFNFGPGGSLDVFIDPGVAGPGNTTFVQPANGSLAWTTGSSADDYKIATGALKSGQGTLDPNLTTCLGGGINCGSFGTTTSFNLTDVAPLGVGGLDGVSYFTSPVPFFALSFQSGQLNNFTPAGTQVINGSLDVVFGVPEPTSLALLGITLLGFGVGVRGRNQA